MSHFPRFPRPPVLPPTTIKPRSSRYDRSLVPTLQQTSLVRPRDDDRIQILRNIDGWNCYQSNENIGPVMNGNEENCLVRSSEDEKKLFDGFLGSIYSRRILRMARFRHVDSSNISIHLFRIGFIEFETKSKKESYEIVPRSVRQFILATRRYLFSLFKHRLKTKSREMSLRQLSSIKQWEIKQTTSAV